MHTPSTNTQTRKCTHSRTHMCTHSHTHACTHTHKCTVVRTCTLTHTQIHAHKHICYWKMRSVRMSHKSDIQWLQPGEQRVLGHWVGEGELKHPKPSEPPEVQSQIWFPSQLAYQGAHHHHFGSALPGLGAHITALIPNNTYPPFWLCCSRAWGSFPAFSGDAMGLQRGSYGAAVSSEAAYITRVCFP